MTHTLEFPGLGLSFELNRVAFSVFGVQIFWYGIIITLAFFVFALVAVRRAKEFGVEPDRVIDAMIFTALGGVIGTRLYFVAFSWENYRHNLLGIFNFRAGGLAIYGGIIAGGLCLILFCRVKKLKPLPMLDLFGSGMLIAQAIGRWGNFVNIEAFGTETNAPWRMLSPDITIYPVHPTFLYESLWNIIGFILISLYIKRRKFDGEITLMYIGWYGIGRAVIEGMRADSLMIGGLRVSQVVAVLCVIAAAALYYRLSLASKKIR